MPTFLIADDSPSKMHFLLHMLQRSAWQGEILTAATSGEACAIIAAANDIVAAFIDFYIPSANGPAIIQALKKKFPHARVALVSSADNARNTAQAIASGAERALCTSRPVDEVERSISEAIEEWKVV